MLSRGGQVGDIVKNGVSVCKQYEWYCMRHPKPIKMLKSIAESFEKKDQKKLIISGAHCPRCGQYVKEGEWYED